MEEQIEIFTDGGSRGNPGPSASAFVVIKNQEIIAKGSKYLGVGTNNNAEYQAVILALQWLSENKGQLNSKEVNFVLDSELVVNQLKGLYKIKNDNIKTLVEKINNMKESLYFTFTFILVRREKNKIADQLVNDCLDLN